MQEGIVAETTSETGTEAPSDGDEGSSQDAAASEGEETSEGEGDSAEATEIWCVLTENQGVCDEADMPDMGHETGEEDEDILFAA